MFNKNIDLGIARAYINEQIKEKNTLWAERLVDKTHLEKTATVRVFNEDQEANHERVANMVRGKDQKQISKIIPKLTEEEKKDYELIAKQKEQEERIEFSKKGMADLEVFLEVINELKEEISTQPIKVNFNEIKPQ
jgi:hypothetical protein